MTIYPSFFTIFRCLKNGDNCKYFRQLYTVMIFIDGLDQRKTLSMSNKFGILIIEVLRYVNNTPKRHIYQTVETVIY